MPCQLCGLNNYPFTRSHIIPEFLFKGIIEQEKYVIDVDDNRQRKIQTGFFEKDILCRTCDNEILSKLERYANNHFYNPSKDTSVSVQRINTEDFSISWDRYSNLDAGLIKLFWLSILWRASLSKNTFFERVNLDKMYAEKIRRMILNNDPGKANELRVVAISLPTATCNEPTKSIIQPTRHKIEEKTYYTFHINQMMYHFYISDFAEIPFGMLLNDNDHINIPVFNGVLADNYFNEYTLRENIG